MNLQPIFSQAGAALLALFVLSLGSVAQADDWSPALQKEIERIDRTFSGDLGVYIRHLGTGQKVSHNIDQDWYLASTVKIPLAIVLMQRAENEGLDLEQKLTLRAADYVDGTGDLLWVDPGARYSLKELNRRSIVDSDSTATDMLIRFLGEKSFGEDVARLVPEGLGPITTILQVRYDAYREVHPSVSVLTNRDFIDLKTARTYQARYDMLLEKLNITAREADAKGVREAFERYYQRGINSGSLEAFGALLEQLVRGELLNDAHTDQLLGYLSEITTGDHRIAGGLPAGTHFAHKTGTQVARSCDIGLLNPQAPDEAVIVAVCARDYAALSEAERAYQAIGKALHESGLTGTVD
ncbi:MULTISPECIES: serine hydrolase [Marinobacter]|uniref:serine hydrolase n=1 Tax=Marinobacter TaxID=2742 RepID=UPI0009488B74|nr:MULTISPECIES: serine hydrolase [unclassified Marinobacter]OLF81791.1 serine hydrolase [Marinobacter sp. C18]|tara:strand:+ start:791 stop:1852 length:1062 start_codon:yes stop_codon:yes gene_type:complete